MIINNPSVWLFDVDKVENWACASSVFTKEECEAIISIGAANGLFAGTITTKNTADTTDTQIRDSQISWLYPNQETHWIFNRLAAVITSLNNQYFNFDVYGLAEGLQFTKYDAPSGFHKKHVDRSLNLPTRKLSISVQLSGANEYEGGDLKLHYHDNPVTIAKDQGVLCAFPSYTMHEVMPVTKGTRYSLVCWVAGPAFK